MTAFEKLWRLSNGKKSRLILAVDEDRALENIEDLLKEVGSRLVDFHVQGESQLLLQPWFQLYLLDAYADALGLRAKVREAFREVEEIRKKLC